MNDKILIKNKLYSLYNKAHYTFFNIHSFYTVDYCVRAVVHVLFLNGGTQLDIYIFAAYSSFNTY